MIFLTMLAALAALFTAANAQETSNSTSASVVENNPSRVTFQAVLQVSKPVQGQITGVSNDNGTGVNFNVNFFSFPDIADGPFNYHIHQYPLPPSGNCTAAGAHLNPFNRQDTPPCDEIHPETCQPGDLSGKHGNISTLTSSSSDGSDNNSALASFQTMYLDLYLSTDPNNVAYFGNRSIVVHAANGTRLNCANFTQMMPTETFGGGGANGTTSAVPSSTPTRNGAVSGLEIPEIQVLMGLGVVALTLVAALF